MLELSRVESFDSMVVNPHSREANFLVQSDYLIIQALHFRKMISEVIGWHPHSYLRFGRVWRDFQGAKLGGQWDGAEGDITGLHMAPPITVFLDPLPELPHILDDGVSLLPCPDIVKPSYHNYLHAVGHVEIIFLQGPLHVLHLPPHNAINVKVDRVVWNFLVPDTVHCAAGQHNSPGLACRDHHWLRDMTDGAHILPPVLWLELHVQEHAPDAPGRKVVVVYAGGGVRAHAAELVLVQVLPLLLLHQGLVSGGDIGVYMRPGPGG